MTVTDPTSTPDPTGDAAEYVLRYAARSDVGLVRSGNEDSGYASSTMLIVADGMGGHAAGELASSTAIAMLAELDLEPPGKDIGAALTSAVENTHAELAELAKESPDYSGMGTTLTAVTCAENRLHVVHVGDSRAYLMRGGTVRQLTRDDSYVQQLVDRGDITEEEAEHHDKRNLLTKALDGIHPIEPVLSVREVQAGDRLLLCSDGLSGVVPREELGLGLQMADPTAAVTYLVDRALENGAPDNVTCVVADVVTVAVGDRRRETRTPVVVGAAAEPRNRSRLPSLDFPADAQPDPAAADVTAPLAAIAEPVGLDAEQPSRRAGLRAGIAGGIALLVALAAIGGFLLFANTQYYVGSDNGTVAVYRGVPVGFGEHGLARPVSDTDIVVGELPYFWQERVNESIPAADFAAATAIVDELTLERDKCQRPRTPVGCPPRPAELQNEPPGESDPAGEGAIAPAGVTP